MSSVSQVRIAALEMQLRGLEGEEKERLGHRIRREKEQHDALLCEGWREAGGNITRMDMLPYSSRQEVVRRATAQRKRFLFHRWVLFITLLLGLV